MGNDNNNQEDLEEFEGLPSINDFIIQNNTLEYPVDLSGFEDVIDLVASKMNFSKQRTSMICSLFLNEVRNALYQNKKVNFIHFGLLVPYGKSSIALIKKQIGYYAIK
jgi:hypothetical protein